MSNFQKKESLNREGLLETRQYVVNILLNRDGPREFDCPRFVIESTDQIWNMYRGIFKQ